MYEYRGRVVSIYDGDTMRLDILLGFGVWTENKAIRLMHIDAPEMGTPGALTSRDWLRTLLPVGSEVILITPEDKPDKYGRYLAVIYLPTDTITSVNQMMLDRNLAKPYEGGAR